jgi:osmotically-inducible protein OsmY
MAQSGAFLIWPTREPTAAERDAVQATDQRLARSVLDLDLAERVERALRAAGCPPLRAIEVTVEERLVTLGGQVPSYYLKQVAQAVVQTVPGAHQIRNGLDVAPQR